MNKLKLAFFGAPDFAARVLEQIIGDPALPVELQFVVTQPDRPAGRKQILTSTPVKLCAQKYNIPVFDDLKSKICNVKLQEVDLVLLYAFGEFIPKEILELPHWGFWNIHPSLLPKYRNTSPIVYSLLLGDKETGVSLIQMDEKLDHGPIIDQQIDPIHEQETRDELENRLSDIGYKLFKKNIQLLIDGKLQKKEQDHQNRTYTRLLTKKDGFVPFGIVQKILKDEALTKDDCSPIILEYFSKYGPPPTFDFKLSIFNLFRALSPWPGIWTLLHLPASEGQTPVEKRLKITGMVVKNGKPMITKVQLEGKKEIDVNMFLRMYTK
ncbi:MAG: methionyl-tRNA formyltransferase [Microgenomates group bacterium]